ncbi:MAG: hypothetical protein M5U28_23785 [Sandaracinaceae bacterium]|nr:hypothetical protein [Sandaracinaceae bacterium]
MYRGHIIAIALYTPIMLACVSFLEVRSYVPVVIGAAAMLLTAAYAAWMRRTDPTSWWSVLGVQLFVTVAFVSVGTMLSPLLTVPVFVAINTLITALYPGHAPRWSIALVGTVPPLAYALADFAQLVPSSMRVVDGALHVAPPALGPMQPWVLLVMVLLSFVPPAVAVTLAGRVDDQAEAARRALHVARWQLAQILPLER